MINLLIDTNIYSHALRGSEDVIRILQGVSRIGICSISVGELLSGFKGGRKERERSEKTGGNLKSSWIHHVLLFMP